jgi:SPP1 family predicted phage head-tail adaptor
VPLRAGSLRHLLTFERRAAGRNAFGEASGAWVQFAKAYGGIEPIVGIQERFQALQIGSVGSIRIRCRYRPAAATATTADRITAYGKVYDIRAVVDVDTAHRELQFLVDEHSE